MKKNRSIVKVERILKNIASGDFSESDIEVLFVTARELPEASRDIFEVGSFVAHNNLRNQGVVRDIMLRNHLRLNIQFGCDKELVKPNLNEFPVYLPELIRLQLRMFDDGDLKKALGIKGGQIVTARRNLNHKKSFQIIDDLCKISPSVSEIEKKIMNYSLTLFNCSDGIELDKLLGDLKQLFIKHGVDENLDALDENKKSIFCILICLVNEVTFSLMKDTVAKTVIFIDKDDKVHVAGQYYVTMERDPDVVVTVLSPVFMADFLLQDVFDAEVTKENIEQNQIRFCKVNKKIILDN